MAGAPPRPPRLTTTSVSQTAASKLAPARVLFSRQPSVVSLQAFSLQSSVFKSSVFSLQLCSSLLLLSCLAATDVSSSPRMSHHGTRAYSDWNAPSACQTVWASSSAPLRQPAVATRLALPLPPPLPFVGTCRDYSVLSLFSGYLPQIAEPMRFEKAVHVRMETDCVTRSTPSGSSAARFTDLCPRRPHPLHRGGGSSQQAEVCRRLCLSF